MKNFSYSTGENESKCPQQNGEQKLNFLKLFHEF